MVILAYRENNLEQVLDFSQFRQKMKRSLQLKYSESIVDLLHPNLCFKAIKKIEDEKGKFRI